MIKRLLVLLILPLGACDSPSAPEGTPLSESALLSHLNFLASDRMRGRLPGTEYELSAARYVRDMFVEYRLEPGASDYLQEFEMLIPLVQPSGRLSQNVLGVLPGKGSLAVEWVIVGAHYDHIGWNQVTEDSIAVMNGADDNASGTALMLEVARFMSEYVASGAIGDSERRSIMFQAYGAEEYGLLGSNHFCNNPTVPMDDIVAMLNFDMVGRLRDNTLALIGTSSSSQWDEVVEPANTESLVLLYYPGNSARSDQACFYGASKPVLFMHTGLHPEYHTARDDVELINTEGMVRIGSFAAGVLLDLVSRPERLAGGEFEPDGPGVASRQLQAVN